MNRDDMREKGSDPQAGGSPVPGWIKSLAVGPPEKIASKKSTKRAEDDRDLNKKIAELYCSVGDEKRARRIELGRAVAESMRDFGRAIAELSRVIETEKNAKRRADLRKKYAELFEDKETAGANLEITISELFDAIHELKSGGSVSLGLLDRARGLAQDWYPEFEKLANPLLVVLAGLVIAQKRQIEKLIKLGQRFTFSEPKQKLTKSQRYDPRRDYVPPVGDIEWEFGGVRPPGTCDTNDSTNNCLKPPEPPTCLDDIFCSRPVNMQRLVNLFGIHRHRLYQLTAVKNNDPVNSYDYR